MAHTVSKFYFHDASTWLGGILPSPDLSSATPAITAAGAAVNRNMDEIIGAAQVSGSFSSQAFAGSQADWIRRFVSPPLAAQTIAAQNWFRRIADQEANAAANFLDSFVIKVWRPSTGAVVGTIVDEPGTGTNHLPEPGTSETDTGESAVVGAAVTCQAGDVLVVEVWGLFTESMATSYTITFYYDGTTEGSTTSAASYIRPTNAITMLDSVKQEHYRIRNDDGTETTATWRAAVDTDAPVPLDTAFRLRVAVANADRLIASDTLKLQYSKNGGAWTDMTSTTEVTGVSGGGNFVTGDPTTQQISSGDGNAFQAGQMENGPVSLSSPLLNVNSVSEWEFRLWFSTFHGAVNGDVFQIRVAFTTYGVLDSYLVTPSITAGSAGTSKSGTDANGTVTEAQSLVAAESGTDSSSGFDEIGALRQATADANGVITEAASITVPISASDAGSDIEAQSLVARPNGTDNVAGDDSAFPTLVARPSDTDGDAAPVETTSIKLSSVDVNGTTSESAAISVPISTSDVNGTITEITSIRLAATDANGAVTEANALVAVFSSPDAGLSSAEIASLRLAAADANSVTTETSTISVPVASSDTNGAVTEGNPLAVQETATDNNAPAVEAAALNISTTDVNGVVTETPTVKAVISATDQTGVTIEQGSTGTNTPVGSNDSNGSATEVITLTAVFTSPDSNGATTELSTQRAMPTVTDFNGVVTEIISAFSFSVADVNGAVSDSAVISAISTTSGDSGSDAESASTSIRPSGVDSGAGSDLASLVASYVLTEGSTTTEVADVSKIALTITDSGLGLDSEFVLKPGIFSLHPPRFLYAAGEDVPILLGASEEDSTVSSTVIHTPVLGGATGRG